MRKYSNFFQRLIFTTILLSSSFCGTSFGGVSDDEGDGEWTRARSANILDVSPQASKTEVKKAYRKLAFKHHPDHNGDAEKFKKVNEANQRFQDNDFEAEKPTPDNLFGRNFGTEFPAGFPFTTPKHKPKTTYDNWQNRKPFDNFFEENLRNGWNKSSNKAWEEFASQYPNDSHHFKSTKPSENDRYWQENVEQQSEKLKRNRKEREEERKRARNTNNTDYKADYGYNSFNKYNTAGYNLTFRDRVT